MNATKITLFLLKGEATSLRTAEIGGWVGVAVAAPRTELDELFQRKELGRAGVYILSGIDPVSGAPRAYIGEAENIYERLKQHKANEFWVSVIVFTSRDDNLTKAHVRYLENRLLTEANNIGSFNFGQNQARGSNLPECDRADMEYFLYRIRQLLPVLGSDLLIPTAQLPAKQPLGGSEVKPPKPPPRPSIKGLLEFIYEHKQNGQTLEQVIELGQSSKYRGLPRCYFKDRWNKKPRSAKAAKPINSKLSTTGRTAFIRKLRDGGNDWTIAWEKILAKYPGSSITNCKRVWEKKERTLKAATPQGEILFCPMLNANGRGYPTSDGFLVLKGSTAVLHERPCAEKWPQAVAKRKQLIADGILVEKDGCYEFTSSVPFPSPSAAANVIHGGHANGRTAWRTEDGTTLKELDALPPK